MIKLHELRDLQRKVEEEKKQLEESQYNFPKGCKKIDEKKLNTFKEKLLNGTDNTFVSMKTTNVLTSDIALLACNRWLNLSILQVFVDLLNKRATNARAI